MFNSQQPSENDLPTSSQLLKSTIIAFSVAIVLLVTVVMPAEYGVDPTGIGNVLGLKKMGEIKNSLKEEALAEPEIVIEQNSVKTEIQKESKIITEYQDVLAVVINPGEAIEIKIEMKKDAIARYSWTTEDGALNFNLHGDGYKGTHQSITYKKGRMISSDRGELIAEFDGYHGWFWRNRNNSPVSVTLEAVGDFIQMKRMK
ncbi:MAG: transmembrane anchor protein [Candidatus Marinimicrobia bacterium]|nr:transmembrane anchor protein [Candidatus Neomarinimicrobiota bacterium]MBL7010909.1 transmembrane anchor protein [Candidatus Neomarinimicrobiota bacterium]MBL7031345.1 transmembrane anchor protein [Candidatus Neomarinimicrobiota bacterium]